jgi:DNA-binding transcriptional MerR regulator
MEYDLVRLSALTATPPRRIRYYISEGLVPSPVGVGPGAHYRDTHLLRLAYIRCMQRESLQLSEIRSRLGALDDAQVREALEQRGWELEGLVSVADEQGDAPSQGHAGAEQVESPPLAWPGASPGAPRGASSAGLEPAADHLRADGPISASARRSPNVPSSTASSTTAGQGGAAALDYLRSVLHPASTAASPGTPPPSRSPARGLPAAPYPSSQEAALERATWERIRLHGDVELHVRRPLSRDTNRRVEELLREAREIFRGR